MTPGPASLTIGVLATDGMATMATDVQEINRALFAGMAQAITKITVMFVDNGVMSRYVAIHELDDFRKRLSDSHDDQAAHFWVSHVIAALVDDPSAPPPADVVDLFPTE